jgi:tetratricopeptide (TPR) repeat protein
LATGGDDGSIKLWPTEDLETLLDKGCRWVNGYLMGTPSALQTLTICQTPDRLRAAASNLVADSETWARSNNIEAAIQGFKMSQRWDSSLVFDPVERANKIAKLAKAAAAATKLKEEADQLLKDNQPDLALTKLQEAITLNPNLNIPAKTWGAICWGGTLKGQTILVLSVCNEAVNRDPDNARIRDSRGLARALTGDTQGAIEDFQFFVNHTPDSNSKTQRQSWIDDLQAGKPPSAIFTKVVLEQLRTN